MAQLIEQDRLKIQHLLREVVLVLSTVNDAEKTLVHIKKEATKEYKKLDDMLDG